MEWPTEGGEGEDTWDVKNDFEVEDNNDVDIEDDEEVAVIRICLVVLV